MENNQRNSRKRLNSLILLVAFTAVMLIVSTYAWFSTQRNVTLTGLKGVVNVAEGLQISLDAERWVNAIDFSDFDQTDNAAWKLSANATTQYFATDKTFQAPAAGVSNTTPTEYLPVSTTGTTASTDGIGQAAMKFYKGEVQNFDHLEDVALATEASDGYFAFDLFLMNTSASTVKFDKIQLDGTSDIIGDVESTGIQNTARIAFALYENVNDTDSYKGYDQTGYTAGQDMTINSANQLTPAQIIAGTSTGKNIKDIAIWEPNANAHASSIVSQFAGQMTWPATWTTGKGTLPTGNFAATDYLPTYALTSDSVGATYQVQTAGADTPADTADDSYSDVTGIKDIYDWSSTGIAASKLALQYTTQTSATENRTDPIDLVSILETEGTKTQEADGSAADKAFDIAPNQYHKIRVYVWIEGQDPDCINYASLGGGLTLDLGFSKPASESSASDASDASDAS